ncbi:MAG: hypothetical protein DCF22_13160, partial [Leptolyngbya sp.]
NKVACYPTISYHHLELTLPNCPVLMSSTLTGDGGVLIAIAAKLLLKAAIAPKHAALGSVLDLWKCENAGRFYP